MKQVVHFVRSDDDYIYQGKSASIRTTADHPGELYDRLMNMQTFNSYQITTSRVVGFTDDGFETNNTIYKAVSWDEAVKINEEFKKARHA